MVCEKCDHWTATMRGGSGRGVVGNCDADMETKMAHQTCVWDTSHGSEQMQTSDETGDKK